MAYVIKRQETTGLWVVVDSDTNKTISRAENPSTAVNLAVEKGADITASDKASLIDSSNEQIAAEQAALDKRYAEYNSNQQSANQTAAPQPTEPSTETAEQTANQQTLSDSDAKKIDSAEKSNEPTDPAPPDNNQGPAPSSDDSAPTNKPVVAPAQPAAKVEKPEPKPNPLHEYATYTYGITLFILSKDDYKQLQEAEADSLSSWRPTNALISSGGRKWSDESFEGAEILNRNPEFNDDFYFDSLRMQTVVGMNSRGRGTNAIDISFTVIEPYGMTLLDRLIVAAVDPRVGSKNYLEQPYLLQIDFFGSKALGEMVTPIPHLTKRIPIKLIEMKIKASTKGAEYAIKAIPFNHSALQETVNTTPANFEVAAATVGDFFKNEISDVMNQQLKEKEK